MKTRNMFLILGLAAVLVSCGGGSDTAGQDKTEVKTSTAKVLKLGHVLPPTHPVSRGMEHAAKLLEEKSGGNLTLTIFHSASQGSESEILQKLSMGTLDISKVSFAGLEQFEPKSKIFSFPYLFRDADHYWKVMNGEIGEQMLDCAVKRNLKGVCYYDAGFRSFYTRKGISPVRTAADLKGKLFRSINSETMIEVLESLGCNATVIEYSELYTSLSQGVVDGAENNIPSLFTSRHYEVCDYYTMDGHTAVPDTIMMSNKVWNKLSTEQRGWLKSAFLESVEYQKKLWADDCEKQLQIMKDSGLQVIEPDKSSFVTASQGFYDNLKDEDMKALVARIKAVE
jgi:tripartite ATP-independent transporter DctP family solute receptor